MLKKLSAALCALCMFAAVVTVMAETKTEMVNGAKRSFDVWDGHSVTENWGAEYSRGGTLEINSAADFIAFRNRCCEEGLNENWGGAKFKTPLYQVTVTLNCDIDLGNYNLKFGCGGTDKLNSFTGKFNGNGHIIKNIKINPNERDSADVQPALNTFMNDTTENSAVSQTKYVGLFPYLQGMDTNNGYPSIVNLHLENVEINIPKDMSQNEVSAGAMVGYMYNTSYIASSSVKNVSFVGGPNEESYTPGKRMFLGGMVGQVHTGYIGTSYVKGVDFTKLNDGKETSWSYKSGMANNGNSLTFFDVYSAGVKYNDDSTTYYDSLFYPVGSAAFTAAYNAGGANAEIPYRKNVDTIITDIELCKNGNISCKVNNLKTGEKIFHGGSGNSVYNYYMIPCDEFGIDYPMCASEKVLMGKNGRLIETDGIITAQFDVLNSTGDTQNVDIILAGYKNGELKDIKTEKIAVSSNNVAASIGTGSIGGEQKGILGSVLKSNLTNGTRWFNYVTTSNASLNKSDYDEIKAFCWSELGELYSLAESVSTND